MLAGVRPMNHKNEIQPMKLLMLGGGLLLLAGCAIPSLSERVAGDHADRARNVAPVLGGPSISTDAPGDVQGGAIDADRRAREQASHVVLRRSNRPWVASVSVPMGSNEKLPSVFQEPVRLSFNDLGTGGKVGLRTVAERITAVTGVPVRVKPDVFGDAVGGSRSSGLAAASQFAGTPAQPALSNVGASSRAPSASLSRAPELHAVAMRWSGSLEGFLNHVTDLTNLSWEYRDGVVVIERFRTEFFEIATLDGETQYAMGLTASDQGSTGNSGGMGSSGGMSTSNGSADVSEKGRAATVPTLIATVNQIVASVPGSSVVRADGSGRIAVTTTKEAMTKVRDFVRAENESMLRQAQIQFDIYSVRREENDERGIEWGLLIQSVAKALRMGVVSPTTLASEAVGAVNFTVLGSPPSSNDLSRIAGGSTVVLQMLNQYGNSTQHRPVSLLTLNRQWARKASLGSKAYVSETVPGAASTLGAGAPGLKTATVTTGDRYLAQPYIMDNHTVVLKFGVGLSSLVQIANFTSGTGPTQQTVQTPEISNLIDQSTVALKAGQLLVITGLSRIVTNDDTRRLTEDAPLAAGGSRKLGRQREDFVIFVRPTIL
ncbi:hypothetical protein A4W93_14005 [Piscinibacter gummiphilus]|uniref:Uncharacterized protein n=3 Tax=Piscinibacter gummiphilus TaxID=946333 RepID=A0A1W6L9E1_9BURK|nr:hypothetical protein A4W93_14005 [Piscinibacter gummiphilus]ATU65595.1 hypothetical protein CPZ87_14085 [Piscinibacter gummiphilus]GLS94765.1 lipoprotein [Piscinibacter gummiphilus]